MIAIILSHFPAIDFGLAPIVVVGVRGAVPWVEHNADAPMELNPRASKKWLRRPPDPVHNPTARAAAHDRHIGAPCQRVLRLWGGGARVDPSCQRVA